jgi:hypothetical protein
VAINGRGGLDELRARFGRIDARNAAVGSMVAGPIRRGMLGAGRDARGGHSPIISLGAGMAFNKASSFSSSLIPSFSASARNSADRWFEAAAHTSRRSRSPFALTPRRKKNGRRATRSVDRLAEKKRSPCDFKCRGITDPPSDRIRPVHLGAYRRNASRSLDRRLWDCHHDPDCTASLRDHEVERSSCEPRNRCSFGSRG